MISISECLQRDLEFPEQREISYLSIRCTPEAVSTTWLISPGFSANAMSSNSFCISPGPKNPLCSALSNVYKHAGSETNRSPLFLALLQSDSVTERFPRDTSPARMRSSWLLRILIASSLVRVMSASRQLLGLRLFLCFTRRWAARILPSFAPRPSGRTAAVTACWSMYSFNFSVSVSTGYSQRDSFVDALKKYGRFLELECRTSHPAGRPGSDLWIGSACELKLVSWNLLDLSIYWYYHALTMANR